MKWHNTFKWCHANSVHFIHAMHHVTTYNIPVFLYLWTTNGYYVMQAKLIITLLLAQLSVAIPFAQTDKPTITFTEKEFNFGTLKETDSVVIHDFTFTNQGRVPLIINTVKSSCGCAVPEWPHKPVLPGKNGTIRISFNPLRQAGAVYKTIQINSNADVPLTVIGIRGIVIPVQRVEDVYKYTIGDLRLQTIYAAFGEIAKGKTATYSIKVLNTSATEPVSVIFQRIPAHLKIRLVPEVLEPKQEGVIEMEYNSALINDWDYVVDRLNLLINGKSVANNRLNVTANIKEDFSAFTADELAKAPRAIFDSHEHNFGNIADDTIVSHPFILINKGQSNLYIRKVSASCGCTAVQPAKTTIAPGDSTVIKAVFNAAGRGGNQKKAITVITNDPRQSRTILWISAVVEKTIHSRNQ